MPYAPKITIITPTFNAAANIETVLQNIANQTYKNIEHLIVDGASTDKTTEIVKKYQEKYLHIKLLSERDFGIYDAMNKGIQIASGDWIYFLGSDDRLIDNNVLESISKIISTNNIDVIYGDVYSTRFNGRYNGRFTNKKLLSQNICHQSIFFKKSIFKITGLFNLTYKSQADWDHNFKWFLSPQIKNVYVDIVIAEYADGGYSSMNFDAIFKKERVLNFLLCAKRQIPTNFRLKLLLIAIRNSIYYHDFSLLVKLILKTPKIIVGA